MSPEERQADITAIINLVNAPIARALEAQEILRRQVEATSAIIAGLQERFRAMEKDIEDIQEKLEEVKNAIIASQERKFKQTIAIQATILLAILSAALAYIIPVIFQR